MVQLHALGGVDGTPLDWRSNKATHLKKVVDNNINWCYDNSTTTTEKTK